MSSKKDKKNALDPELYWSEYQAAKWYLKKMEYTSHGDSEIVQLNPNYRKINCMEFKIKGTCS